MDRRITAMAVAILLIFLFVGGYYFLYSGEENDYCSRASITKRDSCCAEAYSGFQVIECVGSWKFVNDTNSCKFVCDLENSSIICAADAKLCANGSYVVRDHARNCEFPEC